MSMKRVWYHGHLLNERTQNMLEVAEKRLGYDLTILQGSYNSGVSASAGTHDGGGAVDLAPYDWKNKVRVLREVGFAAWHRPAISGLWGEHVHAIAIGDPELSSGARAQVTDYYNGRNGLADNGPDDGPRLHPIPVWPIDIPDLSLSRVVKQFKADHPTESLAVKKIQHALNVKFNKNLLVDGVAGPQTREAYKQWEHHIGSSKVDGVPGHESVSKLVSGYYHLVD